MTAIVRLPFPAPPLRSNDRLHWRAKAKIVAEIRRDACVCALRDIPEPLSGPVAIVFVWTVTDKRRRDVSGAAPTCKAAVDGIVDSGRLVDDNSRIVVQESYRIERGDLPSCRVEIHAADIAVQHVSAVVPDVKAG